MRGGGVLSPNKAATGEWGCGRPRGAPFPGGLPVAQQSNSEGADLTQWHFCGDVLPTVHAVSRDQCSPPALLGKIPSRTGATAANQLHATQRASFLASAFQVAATLSSNLRISAREQCAVFSSYFLSSLPLLIPVGIQYSLCLLFLYFLEAPLPIPCFFFFFLSS